MDWYEVRDAAAIFSPALLFYKDRIRRNVGHAIEMARDPRRLRPHVKTHKTREIVRMQLEAGITKFKGATVAEIEMVASAGAPDVLLAYNPVGPNCERMARLIRKYPETRFSALVDHGGAAQAVSDVMVRAGLKLDVLLDIDVGHHRTGIAPGEEANRLYAFVCGLPGLAPSGFHVYDGHNQQEGLADRETAVRHLFEPVLEMRCVLEKKGLPVPRVVAGGTPTFPIWARMDMPGLECSPGTCFLHDNGYGSRFADMSGFQPAAVLFTRVISKPTPTRLTLDLGYKAVASDPPAGKRCVLLNVPSYEAVLQNEEHFAIETPLADRFQPGAEIYAIPTHVCPTCAMHRQAFVVEAGRVTETWDIVGRDRMLTI
jgi:D-serine deaminase-like pyridoxal phosphate-dependent protein